MQRITENEEFDRLLEQPLAILLKHSTMCPVSAQAHEQAESFLAAHPDAPQVLVMRDGRVIWHESHFGVTSQAIAERTATEA